MFFFFAVFAVFAVQNTKLNQRHLSIKPDWAELATAFFTDCHDLTRNYQHFWDYHFGFLPNRSSQVPQYGQLWNPALSIPIPGFAIQSASSG
jgi:hypothetical protein